MSQSKHSSVASVVSVASAVDESANDRVLLYPKGYITISLDIPRSKSMFVVVKVQRITIWIQLRNLISCQRLSSLTPVLIRLLPPSYLPDKDFERSCRSWQNRFP